MLLQWPGTVLFLVACRRKMMIGQPIKHATAMPSGKRSELQTDIGWRREHWQANQRDCRVASTLFRCRAKLIQGCQVCFIPSLAASLVFPWRNRKSKKQLQPLTMLHPWQQQFEYYQQMTQDHSHIPRAVGTFIELKVSLGQPNKGSSWLNCAAPECFIHKIMYLKNS